METRILQQGNKYYPQYRRWWGWNYFLTIGEYTVECDSLEGARLIIQEALNFENIRIHDEN